MRDYFDGICPVFITQFMSAGTQTNVDTQPMPMVPFVSNSVHTCL